MRGELFRGAPPKKTYQFDESFFIKRFIIFTMIDGERMIDGRSYFNEHAANGLEDGTFTYDESGTILQRADTARPLKPLPGHEPPTPPTAGEIAAGAEFLSRPPMIFDE